MVSCGRRRYLRPRQQPFVVVVANLVRQVWHAFVDEQFFLIVEPQDFIRRQERALHLALIGNDMR